MSISMAEVGKEVARIHRQLELLFVVDGYIKWDHSVGRKAR